MSILHQAHSPTLRSHTETGLVGTTSHQWALQGTMAQQLCWGTMQFNPFLPRAHTAYQKSSTVEHTSDQKKSSFSAS